MIVDSSSISTTKETSMFAVQSQPKTLVPAGTWAVDPVHSKIGFEVISLENHVAAISGRFTEFEGTLAGGDEPDLAGVVHTPRLNTDNEQRDADVRSADMLDVERFPEIRFVSTSVEHVGDDRFLVRGDLTIKETPLSVELEARLRGTGTDAWGNEKVAIRFDGAIEWGPTRVELTAEVSAARQ
jgi:polyisoprenoid-binding protein YceI